MHSETMPVNNKSNPWWMVLKIALSITMLVWVAYKIELWKMAETLKELRLYYLLPAFLAFVASKIVSSLRLNYFFRDIQLRISERENIKLYWVGMLYNTILPGGIGGDGYKTWYLHKNYPLINWKRIAKAIVMDRVAGLFALLMMCAVFGILVFFELFVPLMTLMFFVFVIYIVILFNFFRRFVQSMSTTIMLSVFVQLLQLLSAFFILYALDVNAGYLSYFLLFLLSSVATIVPFTVGGAGMRELVFLYCSSWFSINMYAGVSMVFIFYLISVIGSLPGVYHLFESNTSTSQPHNI